MVFEFANGAIGQWNANRYNEPNCTDSRYTSGEFLVEGNGGSIRLHMDGRITLQKIGDRETEVEYPHERRGFPGDCCCATQGHSVDRIPDGGPFETDGHDYMKKLAGQILPGVPFGELGPEARFPGMAYVVFPGNVGGPDALEVALAILSR